ncbi:MAG: hypothetical protein KBT36_04430 [Kurthia sp.]|nr:hypothetical protein [Candidatus Kurthia equi]
MTARQRQIKNVGDLVGRASTKDKDNVLQEVEKEIKDGQSQNAASSAENIPSDNPAAGTTPSTNNDEQTNDEQTVEQISELQALKEKIKNFKKEPPKEPVTFFLTAENTKRIKGIKGRGMKSKLINELLDLYFSED